MKAARAAHMGRLLDVIGRQMLSRPDRDAGDAGYQDGIGGEAEASAATRLRAGERWWLAPQEQMRAVARVRSLGREEDDQDGGDADKHAAVWHKSNAKRT